MDKEKKENKQAVESDLKTDKPTHMGYREAVNFTIETYQNGKIKRSIGLFVSQFSSLHAS